jgi:hypothetical protein
MEPCQPSVLVLEMLLYNKLFLLRDGGRGLGKLGAQVRALYLQQGQDPGVTDVTAAERRTGGKDACLVQHLVPEEGQGVGERSSGCLVSRAVPVTPGFRLQGALPAHCPPATSPESSHQRYC